MKFLAGLLAGLSVVLGSWGLVACGGTDSSTSSTSSEAEQPKGVVYEVVGGEAVVTGYDGEEESVTIEATYEGVAVTKIGDNAFKGCTSLTEIVIPDSVTVIGKSAFEDCSGFTEFVIPDTVTTIGNTAFQNCTSLTSVTIGSGVTSIGDGAFDFSTALMSMTYNGTVKQWGKIQIATSWLTQVNELEKVVCTDGEVDL